MRVDVIREVLVDLGHKAGEARAPHRVLRRGPGGGAGAQAPSSIARADPIEMQHQEIIFGTHIHVGIEGARRHYLMRVTILKIGK